METATPHNPPEPATVGHERNDVSTAGIVRFAIVLVVGVGVVQFIVSRLYSHWVRENLQSEVEASPMLNLRQPPPEPRLQPSQNSHESLPRKDMRDLREQWQRELTSYGKVPGRATVARIPITRAIELLSTKGLPSTSPTTHPAAPPLPSMNGGAR